jgi:hypothetical protein
MAKAATASVETVETVETETLTGVALLFAIKQSPVGYLMLNQAEAGDIVAAGQAAIRSDIAPDGDKAPIALTPLGEAAVAAATPAQVAPAKKRAQLVVGAIRTDLQMPTFAPHSRAGRAPGGSKYPFEQLEVGTSFHVASNDADKKPEASIQSALTMAHEKFSTPVLDANGAPVMETVTEKTYQKENGKFVKDADGKRVIESAKEVQAPKTQRTRVFQIQVVDATDPDGAGIRVWRTA